LELKNGINITQDDEYAIKFTTNARIKHNKINTIEKYMFITVKFQET